MPSKNFSAHFASLTGPRKNNHNKHHKLGDILILTILAEIWGADSWVEIEEFGKACLKFIKIPLNPPFSKGEVPPLHVSVHF